jgi:hypothetical protein
MISIRQPGLALHSCDVPGFRYRMQTTWNMPAGAQPTNVTFWISSATDRSPDLELANVVINCHGSEGQLFVGGLSSPPIMLKDVGVFNLLRNKDIGTIWLVSCNAASGTAGQRFCSQLAVTTGCDVVAGDEPQCVENRYSAGGTTTLFGTIDDFEGTAWLFSPSGSKSVFSVYDPDVCKS